MFEIGKATPGEEKGPAAMLEELHERHASNLDLPTENGIRQGASKLARSRGSRGKISRKRPASSIGKRCEDALEEILTGNENLMPKGASTALREKIGYDLDDPAAPTKSQIGGKVSRMQAARKRLRIQSDQKRASSYS